MTIWELIREIIFGDDSGNTRTIELYKPLDPAKYDVRYIPATNVWYNCRDWLDSIGCTMEESPHHGKAEYLLWPEHIVRKVYAKMVEPISHYQLVSQTFVHALTGDDQDFVSPGEWPNCVDNSWYRSVMMHEMLPALCAITGSFSGVNAITGEGLTGHMATIYATTTGFLALDCNPNYHGEFNHVDIK